MRRIAFALLCLVLATSTRAQNQGLSVQNTATTGYFDVTNSTGLSPANITVEAYVTYDETTLSTPGNVWPTILRKNVAPGGEEYFLRVNAGNTANNVLRWSVRTPGGMVVCDWAFGPGQLVPVTHVAATWDGATSTLYVNGAVVATATGSGSLVDNGGALRVGNGDPSTPELWNGIIDELRIWSVARSATDIQSTMFSSIQTAPNLVASYILEGDVLDYSGGGHHGTAVAPANFATFPLPSPEYQANQPTASFDIDGVQGSALQPAVTSSCEFSLVTANLSTILTSTSYNLVLGFGPVLPASGGGIAFPDGQIWNANLVGAVTLSGGPLGSFVPWAGNLSIPALTPPAGTVLHAQPYFLDGAAPIGFSLGQAATLESASAGSISLTLGDDTTQAVTLPGPPLCGTNAQPFYGNFYSEIFVNSNGSVSFGAGNTSFSSSAAGFASGPPRIAGMWTDLSPNAGGSITVLSDPLGIRVSFVGVPQYAIASNLNSFDILLEPTGQTTIMNYVPAPAHSNGTLVGISPGGAATDPGSVSFLGLAGGAFQSNAPTDMVYEYTAGAAVPGGWGGIVFPSGDSSAWFVY